MTREERMEILKNTGEYKGVKKRTCNPHLMRQAYEMKLTKDEAIALIVMLDDEWHESFFVPPHLKLSNKPIRLLWFHKNGIARGGYYLDKHKELRPFLRLPVGPALTAGLVMHEFCHIITIYHACYENERRVKRSPKHGMMFVAIFDYLLFAHKKDWLDLKDD